MVKKKTNKILFWIFLVAGLISWLWVGDPIPFVDEIATLIGTAFYYSKAYN